MAGNDRKLVVKGLGPDDRYMHDPSRQTLFIVTADYDTPGKQHRITVSVFPALETPHFDVNGFWSDHGPKVFAFIAFILSFIVYWPMMNYFGVEVQ